MSRKTRNVATSEERIDTIVGVITVIVALALVVWLFAAMSRNASALSEMDYNAEIRRGSEQEFSVNVQSPKIKNGARVQWIVNGNVVQEEVYNSNSTQPLKLNYALNQSGQNQVTVKVGKYVKSTFVNVLPPRLTVTAPDIVITYGDKLPTLPAEYCGFIEDDCREMIEGEETYFLCDCNDERIAASDKLNAGIYKINVEENCCFKDYDVEYVGGTLTVLPKKINVQNGFCKTYDSTNVIENPKIMLSGVEVGDEVTAKADKLYFENKNAGMNKSIMLANVELTGKDSCNYELCGTARGDIMPKQVEIVGLTVRDKTYDGTTRAQIEKMGTLQGVVDGDFVAIGNISLSFAEANVGEQEIVLDNVSLVGADKNNYVVSGVDTVNASIGDTLWKRIFVKNPVVDATGE